jgi:hypothetical protein
MTLRKFASGLRGVNGVRIFSETPSQLPIVRDAPLLHNSSALMSHTQAKRDSLPSELRVGIVYTLTNFCNSALPSLRK